VLGISASREQQLRISTFVGQRVGVAVACVQSRDRQLFGPHSIAKQAGAVLGEGASGSLARLVRRPSGNS
jgi:hypothetical protein